ncbi:MAG TPA: hypothetical protein VH619_02705, partial [Verrucomicrobiae bacterium]|nr:hypothetical protein [Verrucomicrobiae bacterium]
WNGTTSTNRDAGSFWTLGVSLEQKTIIPAYNWSIDTGDYQLFSINVTNLTALSTIVTGPQISISQPVASEPVILTYPATNFPFVLQQNIGLNTTNWTAVSGVILSGTNVNNQAFFVLPATATQMFYRLGLPQ